MYGWEARFPLEVEKVAETNSIEEAVNNISMANVDNYIKEILEKQKSIFFKADTNIKVAQEQQKKQYTQRKGITEYSFKIEDKTCSRKQEKERKWRIAG